MLQGIIEGVGVMVMAFCLSAGTGMLIGVAIAFMIKIAKLIEPDF